LHLEDSKNQCCGKIDCSAEEETEEGTKSSSSMQESVALLSWEIPGLTSGQACESPWLNPVRQYLPQGHLVNDFVHKPMAWHGSLPYATDANQWVDNKQNGAHIGKTPDYEKAGNFSFTKWP
jgi:hypothetical protein